MSYHFPDQEEFQHRALTELGRRKTPPSFNAMLGMEFVECNAAEKTLVLRHKVEAWELNVMGTVHGGVVTGVLDSVMGALCRCSGTYLSPTLDIHVSFLRPVREGETMYCRAQLLHEGRNVLRLRCDSWTETPERLCATAEGAFYIISRQDGQ